MDHTAKRLMPQKMKSIETTINFTCFLSEPSFLKIVFLILNTSPDHIQSGPALLFLGSIRQARQKIKMKTIVKMTLMLKDMRI